MVNDKIESKGVLPWRKLQKAANIRTQCSVRI